MGIVYKNGRTKILFTGRSKNPLHSPRCSSSRTKGGANLRTRKLYSLCHRINGLQILHIKITNKGRTKGNCSRINLQNNVGMVKAATDRFRENITTRCTTAYVLQARPHAYFLQSFTPLCFLFRKSNNCQAILFQVPCKEQRFCLKIGLHIPMIIKMITGQIGKSGHIKMQFTDSVLCEPMGRNFHNNSIDPGISHLAQNTLQQKGFRSGERRRKNVCSSISSRISIIDSTDNPNLFSCV